MLHNTTFIQMTYRDSGKTALSTVLDQEKDINIVEKNVYTKSTELYNRDSNDPEEHISLYKQFIYQIIDDLSSGKKIKDVLTEVKQGKIGWKHSDYHDLQIRLEEQDDFIQNPFEVVEGVLECTKCKSKRVFYYQKQCRGSDEPMTTFATCCACGNKWTYNG